MIHQLDTLFTSWWELEPSDIIINYCSGVNVNFF